MLLGPKREGRTEKEEERREMGGEERRSDMPSLAIMDS